MKKVNKIVWLPLLIFSFISCSDTINKETELTPKALQLNAKQTELLQKGNNFGFNMYQKMVLENANPDIHKNILISPLSASIALTMALNGSNGETKNQIQTMLGFDETLTFNEINSNYKVSVEALLQADTKVKMGIANAAFYKQEFELKSSFTQQLETNFDAEIEGLDFMSESAVTTINNWASDKTNKKITKVIDSISKDAVLILMNALYFKGDWKYTFDKSLTEDRPFTLLDGTETSVPTMKGLVNARTTQTESMHVIELPYGRGNYSMTLLLPKQSLTNVYAELNADSFRIVSAELDAQTVWLSAQVELPKFKFSFSEELNYSLKTLGMLDAFDASKADFSGISEAARLFISFVKQDTFIEVNEKGTEAAAVTTIGFETTSVGPEPTPPVYVFDKPFMFVIRERTTNTILFIGSVLNPLNEN